ncbi:hypothetical protein HAX54_008315, partial [Datura stramonium]|nr:hypothetical protein [Datura stramonium]
DSIKQGEFRRFNSVDTLFMGLGIITQEELIFGDDIMMPSNIDIYREAVEAGARRSSPCAGTQAQHDAWCTLPPDLSFQSLDNALACSTPKPSPTCIVPQTLNIRTHASVKQ